MDKILDIIQWSLRLTALYVGLFLDWRVAVIVLAVSIHIGIARDNWT